MVLSTEWSQVEVIDLVNDGNGLGFILVGGRSTGVVIKALTPGGVAERDGRLQCGDHLLQIGEVNLRGFSSEQVATVLRQTGAQVRLIVARPVEPTTTEFQTMACHAPIIPTKLLSDPEELSRHLFQNPTYVNVATAASLGGDYFLGTPDTELADLPLPPIPTDMSSAPARMCPKDLDIVPFSIVSPPPPQSPLRTAVVGPGYAPPPSLMDHIETVIADGRVGDMEADPSESDRCSVASSTYIDSPETETYVVELHKNVYGLGITVAGYVCEEEDLSGIFVKSIIEGSAAETSGQIQINDRIVAVDGKTLAGVTNHQAVEILRNTDIEVHLTLERFLRGRKFEHLQVALTELKGDSQSQISLPASPSIATLSWLPPKSDADSIATDGGMVMMDFASDMPSRDTVDSNMSHMLDRSSGEHSGESGGKTPPTSPDMSLHEDGGDEVHASNCNGLRNGIATDMASVERALASKLHQAKQMNGAARTPLAEAELQSSSANRTATTTPTNAPAKRIGDSHTGVAPKSATATATPTPTSTPVCTPSVESLKVTWKSLGISLEGTVDVECGVEKRPHHYIRSILEDGPVGRQGILKPGDELLQVNEFKLQGLRHIEVVKILKELPSHVKLVCARGATAPSVINTSQNPEAFETRSLLPGGHQSLQNLLTKAQSESSLYTSSTATLTDQQRSRSLENVSGLALWSSDVTIIEIEKTEQGFGFSILDYQDPMDSDGSVIVIRGLIRGGSAETTNDIFPGDRLVSVGEHSLQGLNLDEAVAILKGMPLGVTKLGICRPLSTSDSNIASPVGEGDSPSA